MFFNKRKVQGTTETIFKVLRPSIIRLYNDNIAKIMPKMSCI